MTFKSVGNYEVLLKLKISRHDIKDTDNHFKELCSKGNNELLDMAYDVSRWVYVVPREVKKK